MRVTVILLAKVTLESKQDAATIEIRNFTRRSKIRARFFHPARPFPLADRVQAARTRPAMTRPAIERCIKVFIVLLILTFAWTVTKVLAMVGWM